MKAKDFKKAKDLYDSYSKISNEIKMLRTLGESVVDHPRNSSVTFKVEKTENGNPENILDGDGSLDLDGLRSRYIFSSIFQTTGYFSNGEDDSMDSYKFEFDDTDSLIAIEILLRVKLDRRDKILKEMSNIGLTFENE